MKALIRSNWKIIIIIGVYTTKVAFLLKGRNFIYLLIYLFAIHGLVALLHRLY